MTKITAAAVAASFVRTARANIAERAACEASRDARIGMSVVTASAMDVHGVTASAIAAEIKSVIGDDRTLAAEIKSVIGGASIAHVIMVAHVGRIYALTGDLPKITVGGESVDMGPRDVLSLVRAVTQLGKGASKILGKIPTAGDRAAAIKILRDTLKDATPAKAAKGEAEGKAKGEAKGTDEGTTVTSDLTAEGKIKLATSLVVDVLAAGDPDDATLTALHALAALITDQAELASAYAAELAASQAEYARQTAA